MVIAVNEHGTAVKVGRTIRVTPQKAEGRRQESGGRRQEAEGRSQEAGGRGRRRRQKAEG